MHLANSPLPNVSARLTAQPARDLPSRDRQGAFSPLNPLFNQPAATSAPGNKRYA